VGVAATITLESWKRIEKFSSQSNQPANFCRAFQTQRALRRTRKTQVIVTCVFYLSDEPFHQ
jgi:hypothetical protein